MVSVSNKLLSMMILFRITDAMKIKYRNNVVLGGEKNVSTKLSLLY